MGNNMINAHKFLYQRQSGGLVMNIGIGIVLGLLAALLAVFLVMKGGPFKEHGNANVLGQNGASTDPNAPLYGANTPLPASMPAGEGAQGDGSAALTSEKNSVSATPETAKPVQTPTADPVGAIIDAANQKSTPKVEADKPAVIATPKPTPALAKEVTPAAAPNNNADAKKGSYTVQAGAFNNAEEAAAMKAKLGAGATVTEKKTAEGTLYRVRVGNYASDKEAQAARAKVGGVVLDVGK